MLGKPAIESLNLVTRVDSVDKDSCKPTYPELLTGLGLLKEEYTIKLKPTVLHLLSLPQEVERMENMGVVSKIGEPTKSCAGIAVVPKPNSKIRICVDLTKLNESICREKHVLPVVDHVLAQLSGATVLQT